MITLRFDGTQGYAPRSVSMQKRDIEIVIECLKELYSGSVIDPFFGICRNLCDLLSLHEDYKGDPLLAYDIVSIVATSWDKYSGSIYYPIPKTQRWLGDSYVSLRKEPNNAWLGEQGGLRKELILFLIETLNKEINRVSKAQVVHDNN